MINVKCDGSKILLHKHNVAIKKHAQMKLQGKLSIKKEKSRHCPLTMKFRLMTYGLHIRI